MPTTVNESARNVTMVAPGGNGRAPKPAARAFVVAAGNSSNALVDHASAAQKRVSLVERVSENVQHRGRERSQSALQHHESHLSNRRIGERLFDARLSQHHHGGKAGSHSTDDRE